MKRFSSRAIDSMTLAVLFAVAWLLTPQSFTFDDAFITLHSARVLLSGIDPAFGVPALVGATSPLHVVLLATLLRMGFSGIEAVRIACALGLVAFVSAVLAVADAMRLTLPKRAALVVMSIGSGLILTHTANGLETGWALAGGTWIIAAAVADRVWLTASLAGLLTFVRPDLGPAALVAFAFAAGKQSWRRRVLMTAVVVAIAIPLAVSVELNSGSWIPSTMRAKQYWFAEGCLPLSRSMTVLGSGLRQALVALLPLSVGLLALPRLRLGRLGLIAIAVCCAGALVALPGAVFHNYFRYPTVWIAPWAVFGLASFLTWLPESPVVNRTLVAVTIAFAAVLAGQHTRFLLASDDLLDAVAWIDDHLGRNALVLTHDAGAVSEFSHVRYIDMVGLKTPMAMAAHARWTWPSCGAERADALREIARASHATDLLVLSEWDGIFRISDSLRKAGYRLTPIRRPPANASRGYVVYEISSESFGQSVAQ